MSIAVQLFSILCAPGVKLTNQIVSSGVISPAVASAGYELLNTGEAQTVDDLGTDTIPGEWLLHGSAADFEVRATLNSGSLSSGTTGAWLSLGTSRSWFCTQSGVGSKNAELLIEIRRGSGVLVSATVNLSALVDV